MIENEKDKLLNNQKEKDKLLNNEKEEMLCNEHGKKIEAFCFDDNTNLCVSCLIESQHKTHNFISIEKAEEKINEIYSNNKSIFIKEKESLKEFIIENKNNLEYFNEEYHKSYLDFIEFYDNLLEEIKIRKEIEIKKYNDIYNSYSIEYNQKIIGSILLINDINTILKKEVLNITDLTENNLNFKKLKNLIQKLEFKIPNIKIPIISNIEKINTINEIINSFEKSKFKYQIQKPKIKNENKSPNHLGRNKTNQFSKLNSITVTYLNNNIKSNNLFLEQRTLKKKNSYTNV